MRALALVLLLSACAPFGESSQAHRYWVLEPAVTALGFRAGSVSSAGFYDTEAMAYSRSPGTRGYYQHNSWTEAPARRIAEVIRLRSSGEGPVVNLHLVEMYHDASSPPGKAVVSLTAENGAARRTFTSEAPAAGFDAAGAVQGFNAALGKAIAEIDAWAR